MSGIKVYTTTDNAYALAQGAAVNLDAVSPTGELAVSVYAAKPEGETGSPWLGSFGSVEAVYMDGKCIMNREGKV